MENAPIVYDSKPLTANDIKAQVDLIQEVMKKVMRDKEHYGVIPGCGDKPALLKPGAEKLNMTFRMAPDPETEIIDLGGGHREYRVKCILRGIETGRILGAGVGSASTMETKWRYRNAEPEPTDKPIPKEYWDLWKKEPIRAQELIGGKEFRPAKINGIWMIAKLTGEKVEYDNPADFYNTCWKMAKKRALVDAVLTVTAASDIFTQDIEEMIESGVIKPEEKKPPLQEPQKKNSNKSPPSDIPTIITKIKELSSKPGKAGDKVWILYTIISEEGERLITFNKNIFELAKKFNQEQTPCSIVYTQNEKGKTITEITEHFEDANAQT